MATVWMRSNEISLRSSWCLWTPEQLFFHSGVHKLQGVWKVLETPGQSRRVLETLAVLALFPAVTVRLSQIRLLNSPQLWWWHLFPPFGTLTLLIHHIYTCCPIKSFIPDLAASAGPLVFLNRWSWKWQRLRPYHINYLAESLKIWTQLVVGVTWPPILLLSVKCCCFSYTEVFMILTLKTKIEISNQQM